MGLQRDSSKHLSHLINSFSFFPPKKPPGLQQGGWGWIFETPLPPTCYELGIVGTPHRPFPLLTQPPHRNPSVAPLQSSPVCCVTWVVFKKQFGCTAEVQGQVADYRKVLLGHVALLKRTGEMYMEDYTPPYEEMDPAIVELCRVINDFPDIITIGSCQGSIDGHKPNDEPWVIFFKPLFPATFDAYSVIEFLAWVINGGVAYDEGFKVKLHLNSAPPGLNGPGDTLKFFIEGYNRHPDEFAALIRKMRDSCFILPDEFYELTDELDEEPDHLVHNPS